MAERRNGGKPRREENNKTSDSMNRKKRQPHSRSGKSGVSNNREDNAGTKKTAYKNPANSNANKSQVSRRKYDVTGGEKQIKTGSKGKNVQGKPRQAHSSQYKPNLNSKCPISHLCGGCQYVDMPYEQQLAEKQQEVTDNARHPRQNAHAGADLGTFQVLGIFHKAAKQPVCHG